MIKSLLIANRGEIACRIIRTARQMGIRTVAVYSDADAKALHVRQADEAVHIGPSPACESYLVGDKIIAAAKATGAEAIHPGYGFLSENAAFAQSVIDAGLVWVGPKPASIEAMGLKDAAKQLMAAAGVPVTPGYMGANQDPGFLAQQAAEIGYPVLIKAVAGGGGKGMRLVESAADFADALASCQREAAASFGNAHVLIEKYIQRPRHIEVQVFGDSHGNVVHLFERDCSLQRRHQKVIEEAPAPGMDEATRAELCAAAVRAAKAVDYIGAGTIEFIADASEGLRADRIWFMEMNTRLQVEHPVTEEITGVDLVEWQLRVASGEPLPLKQDEMSINGWAMEARLYAEDPAKGFLPSVGKLAHFYLHDEIRVETGVEEADEISPFYDPMIAKLIAHGQSRDEVRKELMRSLSKSFVAPVRTNSGFLYACLDNAEFSEGNVTTGLIAASGDALMPPSFPSKAAVDRAAATFLEADFAFDTLPAVTLPSGLRAFRLNAKPWRTIAMETRGEKVLGDADATVGAFRLSGPFHTALSDHEVAVTERGESFIFEAPPRQAGTGHHSAHDGDILSSMPGKVIAVEVSAGQAVAKGQKLLTLEAMKMEHTLTAPFDGVVAELNAAPGAQVQVEALLARIEAAE
ncbi:acetyl/propionyl/methylcrotonyl-CoA carboxylase subunit alpha [Novosphingobium sp.]|uniref:acetyl/propionyl/methylcrotonyl-CoA carboxylase subunit alpha n=1 Tax=Novosphingobium sp. TaxID=1874826 RepID=UPI0022C4402D|nr:acetyl/propionyl/methylcrotonyl-CoA carboxylase subunit alpha [Novosphingobium sp.]MCZ8018164.1 acetyl/propionyl/methylcrotonyl-CoA carboxylase subunit alpha [Novosphingobium sp.]MCZ8033158.1 acetyl/propionyl/methylcrotonyl-CoA carboxylase subunit alpha [Novosphingobium sp.]MCZ8051613.1 acetyl/propionyl/methylcrotonyl-CoA carboxylase subunit alpha [Novosphingobium sp.]MCZ8060155.1 acetyl/propionyl/methylcrotonyl-CoA carboxylase subunit alpha [Novosphingobium sp.]MCZ8231797.1 acetyl/propiony